MHHLTLALDAAAHGDHACGYHRAAEPVEHLRPHHEIGDTRLVLEGDEHDPLGAARTLAHQHQPGRLEQSRLYLAWAWLISSANTMATNSSSIGLPSEGLCQDASSQRESAVCLLASWENGRVGFELTRGLTAANGSGWRTPND